MKRKLLSVFLALCMTLTLVPAASAYRITDSAESPPKGAKFKVDYYKDADSNTPVETRYFNNEGNDDGSSEDDTTKDHFWDPITVMGNDQALSGCTRAVITLFQDIELTDTTILVAKGHDVTITSDGEEQHKITCTLTGTLGNNLGSAHVPGQDAISIANDSEENKLTLSNVSVEIKGPQAEGTTDQTGNQDTQGIYNDGQLYLYGGTKVIVNGVSQNGINGSGIISVYDEGTILDIKNVGGSGIKGSYVSLQNGASAIVNSTKAHGVTVNQLDVTNACVTTTDTTLYGIIANNITMKANSVLSATCAEDAEVPVPIRILDYGDIAGSATIHGIVWAEYLIGEGGSRVELLASEASIENTKYITLEAAVEAAEENSTIHLLRNVHLNEKLIIDKKIILDGTNHTIIGDKNSTDVYIEITGGDVTIRNLKVKDFGSAVPTSDQWGLFKVPEESNTTVGKLILSNVTAADFNCAAVDVRKGSLRISDCDFDCTSQNTLTKGIVAKNVKGDIFGTTITNAGTTSTEGDNACAVETWGNTELVIQDCTFGTDGKEVKNGVNMNTGDGDSVVTMGETTIAATDHIAILNSAADSNSTGTSHLTIGSGYYKGKFKVNQEPAESDNCSIWINNGYFTTDPTAYVGEWSRLQESDQPGYKYMVVGPGAGDGDTEIKPVKVRYYTEMGGELIDTRYFENSYGDSSSEVGQNHLWGPIAAIKTDAGLKECTYADIMLYDDIDLGDTTILVDQGLMVSITSNNADVKGHTITCTLSGTIPPAGNSGSAASMNAISVEGTDTLLILNNVNVKILGPNSTEPSSGNYPTQGVYNDGKLHLQDGASITVDGVSQNGINGNGELGLMDNTQSNNCQLNVSNVGGSGIQAEYLSLKGYESVCSINVNDVAGSGIDVDQLHVYNSSIQTTNTGLYGVTAANGISLIYGGIIDAALNENSSVPAPIRLENGELSVHEEASVTGTVLLGDNATVTGAGKDTVQTMRYVAAVGDIQYVSLDQAIQAATSGQTVKLRQDVTLRKPLIIDKAITLEGNGKTITGQKNSSDVFLKVIGNDVTLQNLKAKDFGGSAVVTQGDTNLTITGCTFGQAGAEVKNGVSVNTGTGASTVTMQNTTIAATDAIVELTPGTDTGTSTVNIESGYYTGGFKINPGSTDGKDCTIEVSGGYFTENPSAYIADSKAAVAQTNVIAGVTYYYTVENAKVDVPTDIVTSTPSVEVSGEADITKEDVVSAIENKDTTESLAYAATNLGNDTSVVGTETQAKEALAKENIDISNATVTVVVEPYLDVKIKSANNGVLKFEIEALYNVKATTNPKNMKEIGTSPNTVTMKAAQPMNVTTPVTISIPLPTGFATAGNLWVKHTKDSGKIYYYQGIVSTETQSSKRLLTFVNPKGFSSFEIMSGFTPVASIGDVYYASLQDAINDVADGGTIKLLANGQMATVSREITFTVAPDGHTATITAGSGYQMTTSNDGNTYTFTKKSGSSGGGGGTSTPTYTVTTGTTSNGTVTVNPKNPTKGSTVTVNVTPNDGYQLDTLTVTDANGKNVEVKKKTDTEYTFTMPASKVTVSAAFVEIPEEPTPSVPQFTDVSEGAWYYDAVRYVCEKGMMNGVAEGVFAPNSTTNRAMIVTILYRLENEPAASGSSFTDVPSGQWYSNAVAWAAANGIVNGVTDTTFAPNSPITREQMAAILYRYAAWKGYDVSGQVDLAGYTDADSVSTYAKEALAWANAEGLITGVTETTLRPAGSAVRAQAATILMRLCENVLA